MSKLKQNLNLLNQKITQVFSRFDSKRWFKYSAIITVILLTIYFIFRNTLLAWGIQKVEKKLAQRGIVFSIKKYQFDGLMTVQLDGMRLTHPLDTSNPLFNSDVLSFRIAPFWGILGNGWIQDVEIGKLQLYYNDSLPLHTEQDEEELKNETKEFDSDPDKLLKLVKKILAGLPNEVMATEILLKVKTGVQQHQILLENFNWEDEELSGNLKVYDQGQVQTIKIKGDLDPETLEGNLTIESEGKEPFHYFLFGGDLAFKKINCSIDEVDMDHDVLNLTLKGNLNQLSLNYKRLSDTLIQINELKGETTLRLGSQYLEIDSQSSWQLNQLIFNAGLQFPIKDSTAPRWGVFKIPIDQGKNVFNSLPKGLFKNTSGIKTSGSFGHRFFVWLDPRKLSNTYLEADIEYTPDFKVQQWGEANPDKLKGSFLHDHYDGDRLVTSFIVGPSNPFYTPLNEISPLLIETTLRSEDPSYYGHKGFYLEAFQEALKANIREKRFARGGSTIPMQLVKNVYLNKQKNLTRKIEEIMLVWLIEKEKAVSKQRMLEVYFNLIEWGPGVFGVGEASRFYFGKHPSQLDIGECCYLSSLIPAPRKAFWSVDSTGSVNPRWSRFTKLKNRIIRLDSTRFSEEDFDIKVNAFRKF